MKKILPLLFFVLSCTNFESDLSCENYCHKAYECIYSYSSIFLDICLESCKDNEVADDAFICASEQTCDDFINCLGGE